VQRALGQAVDWLGPTPRGESRATFFIRAGSAGLVLKTMPAGTGVLDNQHRLARQVAALGARGYPVPGIVAVGEGPGVVFTVQEQLPGRLLETGPGRAPEPRLFSALLPRLLEVVELQAGAGDLARPPWPQWLVATIAGGGEGYCLHSTMRSRPDTSELLDRLMTLALARASSPVNDRDVLHFDLNPANILHGDGVLTGVVDWNIPFAGAGQGDRGFDLATLLFYSYDLPATRPALWEAALRTSGEDWTVVYLCHLVLRQVEWSVRHRPGSPEERRFLGIATAVINDCEALCG